MMTTKRLQMINGYARLLASALLTIIISIMAWAWLNHDGRIAKNTANCREQSVTAAEVTTKVDNMAAILTEMRADLKEINNRLYELQSERRSE